MFSWAATEPRSGEDESRSGERRKTSGYLGLESHFHADVSCQTRQIDSYKTDQSQLSNHASPRYYQSNEPIILICVFVKISTNPSLRVRSWPWCLHESEIQVHGNQRVFSSRRFATRLHRFAAVSRLKKNLWDHSTEAGAREGLVPQYFDVSFYIVKLVLYNLIQTVVFDKCN